MSENFMKVSWKMEDFKSCVARGWNCFLQGFLITPWLIRVYFDVKSILI